MVSGSVEDVQKKQRNQHEDSVLLGEKGKREKETRNQRKLNRILRMARIPTYRQTRLNSRHSASTRKART